MQIFSIVGILDVVLIDVVGCVAAELAAEVDAEDLRTMGLGMRGRFDNVSDVIVALALKVYVQTHAVADEDGSDLDLAGA